MLFDLQGRGRRRAIKIIYASLAVLMGGGLVLFGIGSGIGGGGGLLDAVTESSGGGNAIEKQEQRAVKATQVRPNDPAAWAELARRRFLAIGTNSEFIKENGAYTEKGKGKLRQADQAWKRHLSLIGDGPPDRNVAALMVQVYSSEGLDQKDDLVAAQEVIAEAKPTVATYSTLATFAYEAGQIRKGDLAAEKAVELEEDKDQKKEIKAFLEQTKQQALQNAGSPTPSPEATLPGG